jgi:4-oxalocrotonate tautomerase
MPHVIVKLWPGRTEEQKKDLTDRIVKAVMENVNVPEQAVSVGLEEVPREEWDARVYQPDIAGKEKTLYKKPGK